MACPKPPGAFKQWVGSKEAAAAAGVKERRMYDWCAKGWVWCYRLASGHGAWRIALNEYGQVMDPPPDEVSALPALTPAAAPAVALAR